MSEYEIEIRFDYDGVLHSKVKAWNMTDVAGKALAEGGYALVGRKMTRLSISLVRDSNASE